MSKAIQGAAMFAGALALGVAAYLDPELVATPWFAKAMEALVAGGIAMEAGAVASALTSNRGTTITTRQPAAARQIIYGTQRVGGVLVYESTTGGTHNQYNMVIALAGHEVDAITDLYLDGRKVYWNAGSSGHSTRSGFGFGGDADGGNHTGPDGSTYNFGNLVYCEARHGDQLPGDVILGLTANDPSWAAIGGRSPYLGGCAYVYLKVRYSPEQFPQRPEVKFTIRGKKVHDPRTGTTAYSSNWALIAADILSDEQFGLGDATVNQAQLIAAANVCDESVALANGEYEARYACHMHYDTSTAPSDALQSMMSGAAGRLSRIGGEWYIWPAYWQGPSFTFSHEDLTDTPTWSPKRSYKDLCNRVTGTYIAPNYPYNVAGNLYDSNGFLDGMTEDTFSMAFQPTNFPQYAADALHGYPSDEWLAEDGGVILPREISLTTVLSVSQAQRVAKIMLLRNRQQGVGSLEFGMTAYRAQPLDVIMFSFPQLGWEEKILEVVGVTLTVKDSGGVPSLRTMFQVQETAASVYEWNVVEEQTIYGRPVIPPSASRVPNPPTNLVLTSSAATALVRPDGTLDARIMVTWDTPLDGFATQIQTQYQLLGASSWTDGGMIDISLNVAFLGPVIAGEQYNVRIRGVRPNGAASVWVTQGGFTAGYVLSSSAGPYAYGQKSLHAEAYPDGTAAIICQPFTALFGQRLIAIFPSGAVDITSLAQKTLYYVYYIDLATAGGDVTPIATEDPADFLGKPGYFLIGQVVTPYVASSGGGGGAGSQYYPSDFQDLGSSLVIDPTSAFDGDASSYANVTARKTTSTSTTGILVLQGGPNMSLSADATLIVDLELFTGAGLYPGTASIEVEIDGVAQTGVPLVGTTARTQYTWTVAAGKPLNSVVTTITVDPGDPDPGGHLSVASARVYEDYIQS